MPELILIPDAIPSMVFWGFVVISFFTSLMTASMGIGGGATLLAVMAQTMPVSALIPVHAVVQTGSNLGRALVMLPTVRWDLLLWFAVGSLFGAMIGGNLVISLPKDILRGILGSFILFTVWGPAPGFVHLNKPALATGGLVSTILTMFVGATGPFVVAFLRAFQLPSLQLVATSAVCMVSQHLLKVIVFGALGFTFWPYLPLIILMICSGFAGTLAGRRILLKIDERKFQTGLKIILTVLSLRLLYTAIAPSIWS